MKVLALGATLFAVLLGSMPAGKPKATPTPTPEIAITPQSHEGPPDCKELIEKKHHSWAAVKRASDGKTVWLNLCWLAEGVDWPAKGEGNSLQPSKQP